MSKYTPATFQPTVRPDWAGILSYLSDKEKIEILTALFKYPSEISEKCQSAFWKEVIKPDLDLQYQAFTESCKAKSRGVRNRWGKISITDVEDMNKTSIRYGIDTEREREGEDESKKENEDGKEEKKAKTHNMLEIVGNSFKATDAVVGVFDRPDGTTKEGIQIKNPRLMAFVRHRFDKQVLNKVSDWAIDHNQRGHTYNATALLKLLCKFQTDVEPTINFNHVQAEYLTFEYKGR
ncbi:MAG: hypothetical protein IKT32_04830 [Clostridia bacterium]|nr:hypothetical protein [Clostridia bacterium]